MSTFSSLPTPANIGDRIDIAECVNGTGVRLCVEDHHWSTAPGDGRTLLEPDEARQIADILNAAADMVDRRRSER